jgi:crotonobetaine/carnitine-CoA ligase
MDLEARIPEREECTVGELLSRWGRERPAHPFLEFEQGDAWSFAETLDRVSRAAASLQRLGVGRGSHVVCWLPNVREAVLGWLAVNYLGAVHVPLNTAYRGRLLQHALELSDASVMLAHRSYLPRLADITTGAIRDVIVVGESTAATFGDADAANGPSRNPPGLVLHDASILSGPDRADPAVVEPWDPIYLMLTSGTTGPSKAVVCTYIQAWCGAAMGMDYFGPEDRLLANLPLFHVSGAGAVLDRLTKGGTCVLVDGFSPSAFWDTVRRFRITGACLVGAMTQFLLRQPPGERDRDHTLRNVVTVPWNQDSRAVAERYGLLMRTAFNMTELAVPIRAPGNPSVLGTCGQPRAGIEARLVDAHDLEVPHGEVGELVLRASRPWEISPGYYRNPAATAAAWRNGWFHTGDAFRRDAEGNFFFVDRLKDAIRRRGENISSFEVEAEALCHPAVLEAAAIPVPSTESEDEVLLVVTRNAGRPIDPRELLAFLVPRMPHFMLPRYVRVIDAMPKTPTAKIEKHKLRAEGLSAGTWDREAHGITVRGGRVIGIEAPPAQPENPSQVRGIA